MESGLFPGLSRTEYEAIDAVNQSQLKNYARSPAHARWYEMNPSDPTPALTLGDATHAFILEPERFEQEYAEGLDLPRRSKADREAHAQWGEDNEGKIPLKPSEMESISRMSHAVHAHPIAHEILTGPGSSELCAVWTDKEHEISCKALVDRYGEFGGFSALVDLKTTEDASPGAWARSVHRYGYHTQAAWYMDGFTALNDVPRRFLFVVVEKKPPYGCCVYTLDPEAIYEGRYLNRKRLSDYVKCKNDGNYPSYGSGIQVLGIPRYALTHIDEEDMK